MTRKSRGFLVLITFCQHFFLGAFLRCISCRHFMFYIRIHRNLDNQLANLNCKNASLARYIYKRSDASARRTRFDKAFRGCSIREMEEGEDVVV